MLSPAITSVLSTGRRWRGSCFGVGLVAIGLALATSGSAIGAAGLDTAGVEGACAPLRPAVALALVIALAFVGFSGMIRL